MVERDRERKQKEFDKKLKSNSDLFNEDTDSESENFEPRKNKYKSRKTLDSSDSEGKVRFNIVKRVFPAGYYLYNSKVYMRNPPPHAESGPNLHRKDASYFISNMNYNYLHFL